MKTEKYKIDFDDSTMAKGVFTAQLIEITEYRVYIRNGNINASIAKLHVFEANEMYTKIIRIVIERKIIRGARV